MNHAPRLGVPRSCTRLAATSAASASRPAPQTAGGARARTRRRTRPAARTAPLLGASSPWLQSIVARSVRWRWAGRAGLGGELERPEHRASSSSGAKQRVRAAASSIASGRPSSAGTGWTRRPPCGRRKLGPTARARAANSRTASASGAARPVLCSPARRSGARLVASRPGRAPRAAARRPAARRRRPPRSCRAQQDPAAAEAPCSASAGGSSRCVASPSSRDRGGPAPGSAVREVDEADAVGERLGQLVPGRSASRVLPMPPGPVSVTSREPRAGAPRARELGLAADERRRRAPAVPRARSSAARRRAPGPAEDRGCSSCSAGPGSIPSSSTRAARAPRRLERVGLPAAAVEGEHQLAAEALAQGCSRAAPRARRRARRRRPSARSASFRASSAASRSSSSRATRPARTPRTESRRPARATARAPRAGSGSPRRPRPRHSLARPRADQVLERLEEVKLAGRQAQAVARARPARSARGERRRRS